jgi:hypothetical protein
MKVQEENSRGIETLIAEPFAKIKATDPSRLAKQAARRKKRNLREIFCCFQKDVF